MLLGWMVLSETNDNHEIYLLLYNLFLSILFWINWWLSVSFGIWFLFSWCGDLTGCVGSILDRLSPCTNLLRVAGTSTGSDCSQRHLCGDTDHRCDWRLDVPISLRSRCGCWRVRLEPSGSLSCFLNTHTSCLDYDSLFLSLKIKIIKKIFNYPWNISRQPNCMSNLFKGVINTVITWVGFLASWLTSHVL